MPVRDIGQRSESQYTTVYRIPSNGALTVSLAEPSRPATRACAPVEDLRNTHEASGRSSTRDLGAATHGKPDRAG